VTNSTLTLDTCVKDKLPSNDNALSFRVVLGSPSPAHHLQNVLGTQLDPLALFRTVNLGAFDDDGVGGQIHSPRQCGSRNQNLNVAVGE
jgi:hypothetical protein